MRSRSVVAVDCYCGAGGLTRGLTDAGIRVAKGIDVDGTARKTYERNNPGSTFVEADMREITPERVISGIKRRGSRLLLAGCAPCQPFSKHVAYSRRDRRRSLVMCMARLVEKILPDFVLMENVPGFGKKTNPYRGDFLRVLGKNKYRFDEGVVNAADYGVPQKRMRYVLLASRQGGIEIPAGTHGSSGDRPYRTVRDAIGRFPRIVQGGSCKRVPNHTSCVLSAKNYERIRMTPRDGGSRRDAGYRELRCHEGHSGHTDVYGRMKWDVPAPTLTCRCISLSNGRFGHPSQNRAISVREAAALQTFPARYVFHSNITANARHVGNAVPVLLARNLGRSILDA